MDASMYAEDGCFVYQVIGEPIEVRYKPSDCDVSRTKQLYYPGEMVAIDRIICSHDADTDVGGPYLRLADATGWLFERKSMEKTMQRLVVHSGLWSFYVGNYPEGQVLLRHPTDRAEMAVISRNKKMMTYEPLQRIYCDRKVQNPQTGIWFYRVQGTNGWLVERRPGISSKDECHMLIEEVCIQTGLFAFQAITEVAVRGLPSRGEESLTGRVLRRGEICIADTIYSPSYLKTHDGPFIHLTDCSGWLMEKENTVRLLQPMSIKAGSWALSVLNPPHGLSLYRQPVSSGSQEALEPKEDREDAASSCAGSSNYWVTLMENEVRISLPHHSVASRLNDLRYRSKHYEPGTLLECDRRLENGDVSYFRVKGTKGWISDHLATGEKAAKVVKNEETLSKPMKEGTHGWTVEFVRGAAAVVKGLQELVWNEKQGAVTFRTDDGVRLHVYYASRTVGVTTDDPVRGKIQLFCHDCTNEELGQIFLDPPVDAGSQRRYGRRRTNEKLVEHSNNPDGDESSMEEQGYRNQLLDVEREMGRVREKEHELLSKIKEYDERRMQESFLNMRERKARADEQEKAHKEISVLVHERVKAIAQRQEIEQKQRDEEAAKEEKERRRMLELSCLECYQTFRSAKARDEHCKTQHGLYCEQCRKAFRSAQALDEHCIRKGHY